MERRRRGEREQGEDEEDQRREHIQRGHEREDDQRREEGDDELRQVLPEELVELLDAVDERQGGVTAAALVEVARAQCEHLLVELAADPDFHQRRRGVADLVSVELQDRPQHDQAGDQQQHAGE